MSFIILIFRDCNPVLNNLFSYALKTIVMEMIREDPSNAWLEQNLAENFLKALNNLNDKLNHGRIDYFFDSNSNLLRKMNPSLLQSMKGWLSKTISKLETSKNTETCRTVWLKYFGVNNK